MSESPPAEFSVLVEVERLPDKGRHVRLLADASQRAALAQRFALEGLDHLEALALVRPAPGDQVLVEGSFRAELRQICGISLESFNSSLEESFTLAYAFAPRQPNAAELDLDPESEDPPEVIEGGVIDLGEAVAEQFGLALDPFPRAPGAVFQPPAGVGVEEEDRAGGEAERPHPFAVLKALTVKKS